REAPDAEPDSVQGPVDALAASDLRDLPGRGESGPRVPGLKGSSRPSRTDFRTSTDVETLLIDVPPEDAGRTLQAVLHDRGGFSHAQARGLIDAGAVRGPLASGGKGPVRGR